MLTPRATQKDRKPSKAQEERSQPHLTHSSTRPPEPGDDAARQAARGRIDAIRERIQGGADFAAVAREASEDPATGTANATSA